MLPLMFVLVQMGWGLWAPVIAVGTGHLLFNVIILTGMARRTGYRPDIAGFCKLLAAALAGYLAAVWLPPVSPAWVRLLAQALLATAAFLLAAWLVKPFSGVERTRLNGLASRRLFIW
jgi:asparagine N-glycosylation enzyme membrane subunit Stt3